MNTITSKKIPVMRFVAAAACCLVAVSAAYAQQNDRLLEQDEREQMAVGNPYAVVIDPGTGHAATPGYTFASQSILIMDLDTSSAPSLYPGDTSGADLNKYFVTKPPAGDPAIWVETGSFEASLARLIQGSDAINFSNIHYVSSGPLPGIASALAGELDRDYNAAPRLLPPPNDGAAPPGFSPTPPNVPGISPTMPSVPSISPTSPNAPVFPPSLPGPANNLDTYSILRSIVQTPNTPTVNDPAGQPGTGASQGPTFPLPPNSPFMIETMVFSLSGEYSLLLSNSASAEAVLAEGSGKQKETTVSEQAGEQAETEAAAQDGDQPAAENAGQKGELPETVLAEPDNDRQAVQPEPTNDPRQTLEALGVPADREKEDSPKTNETAPAPGSEEAETRPAMAREAARAQKKAGETFVESGTRALKAVSATIVKAAGQDKKQILQANEAIKGFVKNTVAAMEKTAGRLATFSKTVRRDLASLIHDLQSRIKELKAYIEDQNTQEKKKKSVWELPVIKMILGQKNEDAQARDAVDTVIFFEFGVPFEDKQEPIDVPVLPRMLPTLLPTQQHKIFPSVSGNLDNDPKPGSIFARTQFVDYIRPINDHLIQNGLSPPAACTKTHISVGQFRFFFILIRICVACKQAIKLCSAFSLSCIFSFISSFSHTNPINSFLLSIYIHFNFAEFFNLSRGGEGSCLT